MAPATSGDAHRSAEHEDVHDAAIGVVGLVPLVETSAHEHAGPALGVRGGRRELACQAYHVIGAHAGDVFLPARREGDVVPLVGRHLTAYATVYAEKRAEEVEDRRDEDFAVGRLDPLDRHGALQHRAVVIVALEQRDALVAEVRDVQGDHVVRGVDEAQARMDVLAGLAIDLEGVPFALVAVFLLLPSVSDGATGNGGRIARVIPHDRLPLAVAGAGVLRKVARA